MTAIWKIHLKPPSFHIAWVVRHRLEVFWIVALRVLQKMVYMQFVPDSYRPAGCKNTNALTATSERNAARMKTMRGCTAHNAPAISDAGR